MSKGSRRRLSNLTEKEMKNRWEDAFALGDCPHCKGTGCDADYDEGDCRVCDGTGVTPRKESTMTDPAGGEPFCRECAGTGKGTILPTEGVYNE